MSEVGEATRIVLVDDDGVCLAMLARGLKRRGFEVCSYSDPRDAVARLRDDRPAAVITDMRMPHLTGLDVVSHVQEALGLDGPPVLVVSADGDATRASGVARRGQWRSLGCWLRVEELDLESGGVAHWHRSSRRSSLRPLC